MNTGFPQIQARIELARRQRSEALGALLSAAWQQCGQRLSDLFLRRLPRRFPWLETPA